MRFFLNTRDVDSQNKLEKLGDLLLTPCRYLFNGKDYKHIDAKSLQCSPSFPKDEKTFLKTALAIVAFIPSIILGALFKGLGCLSRDVRHNFILIKNHTLPKDQTNNIPIRDNPPVKKIEKLIPPKKIEDPKPDPSTAKPPSEREEITICKFSEIDLEAQEAALEEIALINKETSTFPGSNWDRHTATIRKTVSDSSIRNILFVARTIDHFVGYAFFVKESEHEPWWCANVAINRNYQGQGIGPQLEAKIFDEEDVSAFIAYVVKTNQASMKAHERFADKGFIVSKTSCEPMWCYTITKPSVNEVPDDAHERSA